MPADEKRALAMGEPPEERALVRIRARKAAAAGLPAIASTMRYGLREMGLIKTLRTLMAVNKTTASTARAAHGRARIRTGSSPSSARTGRRPSPMS